MKTDSQNKELVIEEMLQNQKSFKGYTIEQIRYQRALVALKKEFMKEKLQADVASVKKRLTPGGGRSGGGSTALSVAKSVAGKLNYLEYIVIAASVFGTVRKIAGMFRKKK